MAVSLRRPGLGRFPGEDNPSTAGGLEVFFSSDRDRPTLIFQHIQKTAGSALRSVIRANLRAEGHSRAVGRVERLMRNTPEEWSGFHRDYYESLTGSERDAFACAMGHTANYLLPVIDGPVEAITLVRDPVDRVISRFYMKPANEGKPFTPTGQPLPPVESRAGSDCTLGDIFEQLGGRSPRQSELAFEQRQYFNYQARNLLEPHYDTLDLVFSAGPSADADLWRERLFDLVSSRYLIGLQERFDEFSALLCDRYGWEHRTARGKIGHHRPPLADVPADAAATIRAYNWLDDELHRFVAAG